MPIPETEAQFYARLAKERTEKAKEQAAAKPFIKPSMANMYAPLPTQEQVEQARQEQQDAINAARVARGEWVGVCPVTCWVFRTFDEERVFLKKNNPFSDPACHCQ